jgi:hypothetical protein
MGGREGGERGERGREGVGEERQRATSVEKTGEVQPRRGQNKKSVSISDRLILTQLILRIKNTKQGHDRIKNRIYVSYSFGASNARYE